MDMKTDLSKILSISGQHGLFRYLAQARNGAIVESLVDKKRTVVDPKNRITTLADISIYSTEGEIKLQDVFLKMKDVLGDSPAPSAKASACRQSPRAPCQKDQPQQNRALNPRATTTAFGTK